MLNALEHLCALSIYEHLCALNHNKTTFKPKIGNCHGRNDRWTEFLLELLIVANNTTCF